LYFFPAGSGRGRGCEAGKGWSEEAETGGWMWLWFGSQHLPFPVSHWGVQKFDLKLTKKSVEIQTAEDNSKKNKK